MDMMNTTTINWRRIIGAILILCAFSLFVYHVYCDVWVAMNCDICGDRIAIANQELSAIQISLTVIFSVIWGLQLVIPTFWLGDRMARQSWLTISPWLVVSIAVLSVTGLTIGCYVANTQYDVIATALENYEEEVSSKGLYNIDIISYLILFLMSCNAVLCLFWTNDVAKRHSDYRGIKIYLAVCFDFVQWFFLLIFSICFLLN